MFAHARASRVVAPRPSARTNRGPALALVPCRHADEEEEEARGRARAAARLPFLTLAGGDGDAELAGAVALVLERFGFRRRVRRKLGWQIDAERDIRIYLEREVRGTSFTELGRNASPPLSAEGAKLAWDRGYRLTRRADGGAEPTRSNPEVPRGGEPRKRRGTSPSW